MRQMNFVRETRTAPNLSEQERIDRRNVPMETLGDLVDRINSCNTPEEMQAVQTVLDRLFPYDRRERLLAETSRTPLGTPAVYYRFMPKAQFIQLLTNGTHTPHDYIKNRNVSKEVLDEYLMDYVINTLLDDPGLPEEKSRALKERFRFLSIEDKLLFCFPEVPQQTIFHLLDEMDMARFQAFFDQHVQNRHKRQAQTTGGNGLALSNQLSASAGGPVSANYGSREGDIYIEFVAPDEEVRTHTEEFEEYEMVRTEKEVFFREIPLTWVTRAYIDRKALIRETVDDPDSAVSIFSEVIPQTGPHPVTPYRHWLRNAHVKYTLPSRFQKRYRRNQTDAAKG